MGSGSFFQATKGGRDEADAVAELFVPEAAKSEAVQKAGSLPKLDITELDLQWIQVQKRFKSDECPPGKPFPLPKDTTECDPQGPWCQGLTCSLFNKGHF